MLGRTCDSAGRFLTDCVEIAYRLPRLWAAVKAGLVAGWRARWIAQTTLALSMQAATYVDEQVFWCASRVTPSQLGRLVEEARVRHMPEEVEKTLAASADKRHVTFDTEQASYDGTMGLEASLEIPDALALAAAVKSGAEHLARLGSTDTVDGRRATALGDPTPANIFGEVKQASANSGSARCRSAQCTANRISSTSSAAARSREARTARNSSAGVSGSGGAVVLAMTPFQQGPPTTRPRKGAPGRRCTRESSTDLDPAGRVTLGRCAPAAGR
jgi:hypothetical protein